MKEAGCVLVLIGFESIDTNNLAQMNKVANLKLADYDFVIKNIYKYGIKICAIFVFGYDNDSEKTIKKTLEFAQKYHFTKANFNILTPMPGTELYKRLEREGKLLVSDWWINDNYQKGNPLFQPKNISPEALLYTCHKVWLEYYSFANILRRFLANLKYTSKIYDFVFLYEAFETRKVLKKNLKTK